MCEDCFALIDFLPFNSSFKKNNGLDGLFCAAAYNNLVVKKLLAQFKYEPFIKDLARTLAYLIMHNLRQTENVPMFVPRSDSRIAILIPVPLTKKRLKERGFNQSEELARYLAWHWKIPLINNILLKTKETLPQAELSKKQREQNIKGAFSCEKTDLIKNKKVILVDDVYTTGSTMGEAAKALKSAGAKEVFGVALARE